MEQLLIAHKINLHPWISTTRICSFPFHYVEHSTAKGFIITSTTAHISHHSRKGLLLPGLMVLLFLKLHLLFRASALEISQYSRMWNINPRQINLWLQ